MSASEDSHELTAQAVEDMQVHFHAADINQDGVLDVTEFIEYMEKETGHKMSEPEAQMNIESVNPSGSDLNFGQFLRLMTRCVSKDSDMNATFNMFDKNKDNFISEDELKQGMKDIGQEADEETMEFFRAADKDGDGKLSRAEFKAAHE